MNICVGIVLYNPDIATLEMNINALIHQVDHFFLFDNASENEDDIKLLLSKYSGIDYYRNDVNAGIAYALNRLFDNAEEKCYEWCLTMDQDSLCCENMISEFLKYIDDENIAMICPFILNNGKYTLEQYQALNLPEFKLLTKPIECITSATLNRVSVIKQLGGFNEKMFIDYVDTELNCRVLQAGYKIIRANNVYMIQSMGKAKKLKLIVYLYQLTKIDLFRRMQIASVYNDKRLYYQSRNSRYVRRKYKNSGFKLSFIYMFFLFIYCSFTYPVERSRIKMWKSIIMGYFYGKKL